MPKKLVLDRAVRLHLTDGEHAVVPEGEVWRVSSTTPLRFQLPDNRYSDERPSEHRINVRSSVIIGAGVNLTPDTANRYNSFITGLAFKLQEV